MQTQLPPCRLGGGDEGIEASVPSGCCTAPLELDRRAARPFALDVSVLLSGKAQELRNVCRRHRVRRLELVGSAAAGTFQEASSDLDFLVVFADMTPPEHARSYLGLIEDLQELFGRRVDLIEEKAIRNPLFREAVLSGPRVRVDDGT